MGKNLLKKFGGLLVIGSLAAGLLTGCGSSDKGDTASKGSDSKSSGDKIELNFGCNSTAASFYQWGVQASEIVNKYSDRITMNAVSTSGGVENFEFMGSGELDLGGGYNVVQLMYWDGSVPFDDVDISNMEISKIYDVWPNYWHIMVTEDSDINCIEDLEGKSIALNTKGSVGYTQALFHFDALGIDILDYAGEISYLSGSEAAEALQDGTVDAMFSGGGLGDATCMSLAASQKGLKLIGYTDEELELALKNRPEEIEAVIPAGTYDGIDYDVKTVSGRQTFCAANSVPEDVVYEITKILHEHADELSAAIPAASYTTPENTVKYLDDSQSLHPGAEKYFRELGLIE